MQLKRVSEMLSIKCCCYLPSPPKLIHFYRSYRFANTSPIFLASNHLFNTHFIKPFSFAGQLFKSPHQEQSRNVLKVSYTWNKTRNLQEKPVCSAGCEAKAVTFRKPWIPMKMAPCCWITRFSHSWHAAAWGVVLLPGK